MISKSVVTEQKGNAQEGQGKRQTSNKEETEKIRQDRED